MIYTFDEPNDTESQDLKKLIVDKPIADVVAQTTGLDDHELVTQIVSSYQKALANK